MQLRCVRWAAPPSRAHLNINVAFLAVNVCIVAVQALQKNLKVPGIKRCANIQGVRQRGSE